MMSPPQKHAIEIADELAHEAPEERVATFQAVPADQRQPVFRGLAAGHQQELLERLPEEQARVLVEGLDPDDRVRLFDQLPAESADALLAGLSPHEQEVTRQLLNHRPESAGRIMSPEYVALDPSMSVSEALSEVRRYGREAETIYALPIVDLGQRYAGMVFLDDLVLADPGQRVVDLVNVAVPTVRADSDQETVARLIQASDLPAAPVIDEEGRLIGLVTVDDAMDVIQFEEGEDLARTGAAEPLGRPYFSASIFRVARSRVVWLLMLAVAAALTVNVLSAFEGMLERVVALSLFIPLLIGIGGNVGAQSATTVVRALAVDDVRPRDLLRVVLREGRVGLLLGAIVALLSFVPVWLFVGRLLAATVSVTLIAICTLAALVGSTMPLLARIVGVDPAVVSAPFVTTIVDATGLLAYFLIARAILGI